MSSRCCWDGTKLYTHIIFKPPAVTGPSLTVLSYLKQYSGKSALEQESEPAKPPVNLEEIRAEIRAELKAKIEEEAYNKGWGLLSCEVFSPHRHTHPHWRFLEELKLYVADFNFASTYYEKYVVWKVIASVNSFKFAVITHSGQFLTKKKINLSIK